MEVCSWENDLYLVIEGENQMMMGWLWDRNVMFNGMWWPSLSHSLNIPNLGNRTKPTAVSDFYSSLSNPKHMDLVQIESTYGMSRFWSPVLFFQFHPFSISIFHHFVKTKALTSVLQVWSTSPTYPTAHSQPLPTLCTTRCPTVQRLKNPGWTTSTWFNHSFSE